jgi:hypothetical protein
VLTPAQRAAAARFHSDLLGLAADERYRDTLPAGDPEAAAILEHITAAFRILAERLLAETSSGAAARAWLSPEEVLSVLLNLFFGLAYGDTPGRADALAPPLSLQQLWAGQGVRIVWVDDPTDSTGATDRRRPALLRGTEAELKRIAPYAAWLDQQVTGVDPPRRRGRPSGSGAWDSGEELAAAVRETVRWLRRQGDKVTEAAVAAHMAAATGLPKARGLTVRAYQKLLTTFGYVHAELVAEASSAESGAGVTDGFPGR